MTEEESIGLLSSTITFSCANLFTSCEHQSGGFPRCLAHSFGRLYCGCFELHSDNILPLPCCTAPLPLGVSSVGEDKRS